MSSYVFVDSRVRNYDLLLASLAPDTQVVILDPTQDGIAQIAAALQGATDLDAIHIISHGSEGTLYLGDTVLTGENLSQYTSELETIGAALNSAGDILLYGCEVANGVTGQSFIEQLAAYTNADVAASTDLAGSAALNGDWVLEASVGAIEAQAIAPAGFEGLLVNTPPVITASGAFDKSFDSDGKLTTPLGTSDDGINSMVLLADGKIVAAGQSHNGSNYDFALVRYNANGSLDSTFDGDGKRIDTIGTSNEQINSMALQANGKIVVAGDSYNGSNSDFALARYNTNGALDTTFDGDGKLTTTIGTGDEVISSVVVQADGRIVVAGYSFNGTDNDFALVRYNTNGSLDTTFDGDGKVTTAMFGSDAVTSLALQADGKIVAAGSSSTGGGSYFALARYNTDGSLDTTFDVDGKLTTYISFTSVISSIALQTNGKIVAGGYGSNGADYDFALARYNIDGSLDSTFGTGGSVTTPVGNTFDLLTSLALQTNGKIVAGGYGSNGTDYDFALARYNTDGNLDTTFGSGGKLMVPVGTSQDTATSVLLQSDGAIVAAGKSSSVNGDFALVRVLSGPGISDVAVAKNAALSFTFHTNTFTDVDGDILTYTTSVLPAWLSFDATARKFTGTPGNADVGTVNITVTATDPFSASVNDSFVVTVLNNQPPVLSHKLDTDFDSDGRLTTDIGTGADKITSVKAQADGKIVVAGRSVNGSYDEFALARYNTDGSLDSTFDGDGKLTTDIGTSVDVINSMVLQGDGKIVVAGYSAMLENFYNGYHFSLARYNTDGSLDSTFDGDGKLTTVIGEYFDVINSVTLQSNGKIVVAGHSMNQLEKFNFALARYNSNGSLDTTFDGDGKLTTDIGTHDSTITGMVLQANGKIVVAGYDWNGTNNDFALARYNTNGSLDTTFSGDGKLTTVIVAPTESGYDAKANSVVLQADGKIVAAGSTLTESGREFALVRYNTNGSLDSTFGSGGKVITPIGTGIDEINSVTLQADGKIVAAGYSFNGTYSYFTLARYNTNGTLDSSFDDDGIFTSGSGLANEAASSLAIQPDGSIVAAGYAGLDFAVLRLKALFRDQFATEDSLFTSTFAMNTFGDPEGSAVTYSATRADGSALPSWLSLDPYTKTFSGTPLNANVGPLAVNLIAADIWGATSSTTFTINVANTNDAPVVSVPISDKSVFITAPFPYTVPLSTFTDVDVGDVLTYAATQEGGFALPAWLTFNPTTRAFTGTPPPEEAGSGYSIIVTATDTSNSTASEPFTLNVNGSYIPGTDGVDDDLDGTPDNDVIDGKTGADTMAGQAGSDTYIVDNVGDVVIEFNQSAGGIDTVWSSVAYTLPVSVENLLLTGSANINGTGNNLDNQITGNSGNNRLDGGTGIDFLAGGAGNDTYVLDNVNDQVNEALNAGTDTLEASSAVPGTTFVLSTNVERIVLTGTVGLNAIGNTLANTLTGNSGNNNLTGGSGNDTLIGGNGNDTLDGGVGADSMVGGQGDDTYIVDNAGDIVVENLNEGSDTVQSSVTWTLGTNVENLLLTGGSVINGTGNTLSNQIIGNTANNILTGGDGDDLLKGADTLTGTTGADTLIGGIGNDLYYIDSADDVVIENAGEGTLDQIFATPGANLTSLILPDNIERVTIVDPLALFIIGNGLNNFFQGNDGDDSLSGAGGNDTLDGAGGDDTLDGGIGVDSMKGGAGNDLYYVDNVLDVVEETDVAPGALIAAIALVEGFIDTVNAAVNYSLTQLVENLTLTGTATTGTGNELDNQISGNTLNNTLTGAQGDDTLDGGAGTDIATYAGNSSDYQITTVNGTTTVTDLNTGNGDDGADTLTNIETLRFSNLDIPTVSINTITGDAGNNSLTGASGADSISGNGGNDTLVGGAGNDTLNGGDGNDTITGGDGNDSLKGDAGDDNLNGGTGTDTASYAGAASAVTVTLSTAVAQQNTGGAGLDTLTSIEHLLGSSFNDTFTGSSAANQLDGALGNDTLTGGTGNDTLLGSDGNDTLKGEAGDDSLSGGTGTDTASYAGAASAVTVTLSTAVAQQNTGGAGLDTLTSIEHLLGSSYNDTFAGNSAANQLDGALGNDTLTGGTGNDTLLGSDGNDTLKGEAGDDSLSGGTGTDTASYAGTASAVTVTLATAVGQQNTVGAGLDTLTSIEHLLGGSFNDTFTGNSAANQLDGATGNDTLTGGTGNDTLLGGTGNDSLSGGDGNDMLRGDAGNDSLNGGSAGSDTASYVGTASAVTVTLSTAVGQQNTVGAGLDTLISIEHLLGGSFNDTFTGNSAANKLEGGSGNDTLSGGSANDTLVGGNGADRLTGGTGVDLFDYNALAEAGDTITDFTAGAGGDKIDLDTLLTVLGYGGADPMAAGYVRVLQSTTNALVQIDSNGGGDNFATTLATLTNVTAANVTLADNFIV